MSGLKKMGRLFSAVEAAGAELRDKLASLQALHLKLIENTLEDDSKESVAIQAYIKATKPEVLDLVISLEARMAPAKKLQQQIKEMKANEAFREYVQHIKDEKLTADEVEASGYYKSLKGNLESIQQCYAECGDLEKALDESIKDLTVIDNVCNQFVRFANSIGVSEESKRPLGLENAEEDFHDALGDLFERAGDHPYGKAGAAIAFVGAALIAAALFIVFPPAGAVAIGLLLAGSVVAAGSGFMFFKAYQQSKDPMHQIGVAMEDKEKEARAALN